MYFGKRIGLVIVRFYPGAFQGSIRVKHTEQAKGAYEIINNLQARPIILTIAGWGKGIDTSGMFVVFVRPEIIVGSTYGAGLERKYAQTRFVNSNLLLCNPVAVHILD